MKSGLTCKFLKKSCTIWNLNFLISACHSEIEDNAFDKPTLPEAECVWGSECDLTCKRINGTRASQYINEALNVSIQIFLLNKLQKK